MTVAREGHKMVNWEGTIYAVGGDTDTVDEWKPLSKSWVRSVYSLTQGRDYFAVLNVPLTTSELCG
jgi:hypothetical protein